MSPGRPNPQRQLLGFVARTVALILALAVVWPFFAPRYSRLVAAAAGGLFAARGGGIEVSVDEEGNLQADKEWHGRGGRVHRDASPEGLRGAWEGLLLVSALLLATPLLRWRRRLALLAAAGALMTLYYAVYAAAFFTQVFSPAARFYVWFPFTEVWVPLLLWAALTFRHWFPRPEPPTE